MVFQKVIDRLEVLSKRTKKFFHASRDKLKVYLDKERKAFIYDTIKFIVFYGILFNLAISVIFGAELSILNTLGCGSAYYVFVDIIKFLADNGLIIFRRGSK